jgi:predicted  nucleic acid-binding Zn-ribbon protein
MTDKVTSILPTFPKVRCDKCRHAYLVDTEQDGLITGNCPNCGHDRFSCTFEGTAGVDQVVKWDIEHKEA